MRALGLFGSLAIGCLVVLGGSCGDDDDNKGDGGTGGAGGSVATGGTSAGGTSGTGGSSATGGTGGSSGGAATFACDYNMQASAHFCTIWDASSVPGASASAVIAAYQSACTQGMGTAVTTCPTSGAVGKCTFTSTSGGYSVSQTIYYYAPLDRATGMQLCMVYNSSGVTATWTNL